MAATNPVIPVLTGNLPSLDRFLAELLLAGGDVGEDVFLTEPNNYVIVLHSYYCYLLLNQNNLRWYQISLKLNIPSKLSTLSLSISSRSVESRSNT